MHEQMTVDRKMRVTQGGRKSERCVLVNERPEKHTSVDNIMRCPFPASAPASAPLTLGTEALVWRSQRQLWCPLSLCLFPLRQSLTEPGDPWLWSVQSQRFSCVLSPKAGIVGLYTDFYVVLGSEFPPSWKCTLTLKISL